MRSKFTFLLPAFKCHYLENALRSIQRQSYKNFKVLISDDCSPEDIYTICKPFLADSRFIYRRNQKNIGGECLVNHWNLLVDLCDTEYLIMASDDDIYMDSFLEEINSLTDKYPHIDLFRARVNEIDEKGNVLISDGLYQERVSNIEFIRQQYTNTNIGCIANFVFKTETIKENGGFIYFPFAWFSDDATAIIMSNRGCVNTSNILFGFRVSSENISYRKDSPEVSAKKVMAALLYDHWLQQYIKKFNCEDPIIGRTMSFISHAQQMNLVFMIKKDIYNCTFADFHRLCKEMKKHYLQVLDIKAKYYKMFIKCILP